MNSISLNVAAKDGGWVGLSGRAGLLVAALAMTPLAHAAYIGPNLFGTWASASADTITSTSGPSEQTPGGPAPNGLLSSNASASGGNGNGAASGQGFANVGLLGGNAAASGCLGGNFQQICISGGNYTEFYDTFQVTGAPSGTPVSIQFTLATAVNLMGFGQGGYQTRFSDGFNQVENSYGAFIGSYSGNILQSHSWTATYNVGTSYSLSGWMNMSVQEQNCPGGSQNCGASNSLVMDLTSWDGYATILDCPGCGVQSASGFNYLSPVPLPAPAGLLLSGLIGLCVLGRNQTSHRAGGAGVNRFWDGVGDAGVEDDEELPACTGGAFAPCQTGPVTIGARG